MKKLLFLLLPFFVILLGAETFPVPPADQISEKSSPYVSSDTFDQEKALADLRAQIAGKEKEPADEVFKNIKMFGKMPAGRMLRIMEMAYNGSLGVTCIHCHNPEAWESDEKPQKQIAREMSAMTKKINKELLAGIENLESETPVINCTTCHRGQIKPALNLE